MKLRYPNLFKRGVIRQLGVKNRIISSPMERNYCTGEGRVTQRYIDHLTRRAEGGASIIYTEATYVHPRGRGRERQMGIYHDGLIDDLRLLVDAVHEHGANIGPELHYGGRVIDPRVTGLQAWAPSVVSYFDQRVMPPHAMSGAEIRDIIDMFGEAASRALAAGFDFIGIHGGHGYLLNQFLSPYTNQRDDEYGGSPEGRARFVLEVVSAVRRAVGNDVPILYRITADERLPGGLTVEDICEFIPSLEDAGVDLLDISAGIYETNQWITQPMEMPQGVLVPFAERIRQSARIQTSVSGRITDPQVAENIIASGITDFVTLGRALHADPDFPLKAQQGKQDRIIPCIACNQGCSDRHARGKPILCLVNSRTGREREYAIRKSARARKVAVVGGGVAGLECARILGERGHRVTLYERSGELGGQMLLNRYLPGREEMAGHIPWLIDAAQRGGVDIALGVELDGLAVSELDADDVVFATGSYVGIPEIDGIFDSPLIDYITVLKRSAKVRGNILIIGGGVRAIGLARRMAAFANFITVVESGGVLGGDISSRSQKLQIEAVRELPNVHVRLNTTVEELSADGAVIQDADGRMNLKDIGLVIPVRPILPYYEAEWLLRQEKTTRYHWIGDCSGVGNALSAIHGAAALAHRL